MKKIAGCLILGFFVVNSAYAGWFDSLKKGDAPKAKTALVKTASKPAKAVKPAPPKRSPQEVRAFNEKIQKERAAFETEFGKMTPGPKEIATKDFDTKARASRTALEKELSAMPPDPKEAAQKEFQQKIAAQQKEFYAQLKSMPAGPKESKRAEFEKNLTFERKALGKKIRSMAPDEKETARKDFEVKTQKEARDFYSF
ncbi:MAG: hypothetical protein COT00_03560 [Candidatus Omnitrophica bacterium CG07_land_8_20_14_0_80_50_8]|nr:MAG: hypothetical protein COT00_03560 [Candidatus Omnitrophica bacterium CG07_land_8_20_14_0_80_50_8]